MAGLLVVELLKELCGEGSIFSDECRGSMACGRRGIDGQVRVARHSLSIVNAEGVSAKGGVGLAVFKRLGLPSGFLALRLLSGCGWLEGVVVQVSRR